MTRINANGSDREPSSFFLIRAHSRHSRANLLLSDVESDGNPTCVCLIGNASPFVLGLAIAGRW